VDPLAIRIGNGSRRGLRSLPFQKSARSRALIGRTRTPVLTAENGAGGGGRTRIPSMASWNSQPLNHARKLVETIGVEPMFPACRAGVLAAELRPRKITKRMSAAAGSTALDPGFHASVVSMATIALMNKLKNPSRAGLRRRGSGSGDPCLGSTPAELLRSWAAYWRRYRYRVGAHASARRTTAVEAARADIVLSRGVTMASRLYSTLNLRNQRTVFGACKAAWSHRGAARCVVPPFRRLRG
jgi:hypothetical protein